ncbi:hypothetical protein GCM10027174_04190 [Salinifilum aidingensis]
MTAAGAGTSKGPAAGAEVPGTEEFSLELALRFRAVARKPTGARKSEVEVGAVAVLHFGCCGLPRVVTVIIIPLRLLESFSRDVGDDTTSAERSPRDTRRGA